MLIAQICFALLFLGSWSLLSFSLLSLQFPSILSVFSPPPYTDGWMHQGGRSRPALMEAAACWLLILLVPFLSSWPWLNETFLFKLFSEHLRSYRTSTSPRPRRILSCFSFFFLIIDTFAHTHPIHLTWLKAAKPAPCWPFGGNRFHFSTCQRPFLHPNRSRPTGPGQHAVYISALFSCRTEAVSSGP